MNKKWYNLFVSVDTPEGTPGQAPGAPAAGRPPMPQGARTAAQAVADIAAQVAKVDPKFAASVKNPTSFEEIYRAAEIPAPAHGYSILKVSDMLQSEHIRNLPPEVKRSSILVALEAAGVQITQVVEDAVRRDRALDVYERVQEQDLERLAASKTEENRQIQSEMDRVVAEHRARTKTNQDLVTKAKERFESWRREKHKEEQRIADAIAHFVSENPITTPGAAAPPPASAAKQP
jgi:ElaB/YqjD/DUF883 family membrane-anchored ribosome-binding protein